MKRALFAVITIFMLSACCRTTDIVPVAANIPIPSHAVYNDGLIADITPEGWLLEILERQRDGLSGHPEAMAYPYNSCLWAGEITRDSEKRGANWWRYEQTAYYLDGIGRLGHLLDDGHFQNILAENITYTLDRPLPAKEGKAIDPKKRDVTIVDRILALDRPEGRLGQDLYISAWPFAVFFRAVKAYYEATGDERIPAALEQHYLTYTPLDLGALRAVVNVEGILWTYSLTCNPALLDLAEKAWALEYADLTQTNALDDTKFHMHGVTMNELLKVPMILYSHTGNESYLQAALNAARKMEEHNMLIDGVNSSSEHLAGNDALASHETCDIVDYSWTMGYFLAATGEAKWADRIEKAAFNAGLGAITKDFKSMQYFSCPNQFIATGNSDHNVFKHGLTWMAYRPIHETECCIGNIHRLFPNYVSRMWLKDANGAPVAALYGPSSVVYDLGDGLTVEIDEKTEYPFEERIEFEFNFFKNGRLSRDAHRMDFTYRIPEWCASESGFRTESREWRSGESFTVELPMQVEFVENPVAGVSVVRGPIVYSYPIATDRQVDTLTYRNMAGKVCPNPDFKCWKMTPAGKWNYALAAREAEVTMTKAKGFPFDKESVPVKIKVPAMGVKDWELKDERFTPALPDTVTVESDEVSYIDLVPYGSTELRVTVFPEAVTTPTK